jgi:WD40 repeat protein
MVLQHLKLLLLIPLVLQPRSATGGRPSDGLGDPLPQRAVARLGSSRLRHGGRIQNLMFSPDGNTLASWGGEYQVSDGIAIWDAATGKEMRRVAQRGAWLAAWAWLPDGRLTAVLESLEKEHSLFDFNAARAEGQAFPERDNGDDRRFAVSSAGNMLAVSKFGRDGRGYTVEFRDLSPDRPARELKVLRVGQGTLEFTTVLRFTPDGRTLIAFTPPRYIPQPTRWTAVLWDVETATERRRLTLPDTAFGSPGQTVDTSNEWLAVGLADGSVILYDLRTGKQGTLPERHKPADPGDPRPEGVLAVRFTRDGKTLVTAGSDHVIRSWNLADGMKSREFAWSKTRIEVMDVSPDGTVLALGGREGVVRLLNASTGAEVCPQPGHERWVLSLAVSPNGRIAATTSLDRTIRIWDLEKTQESRVITCAGFLKDCALAPNWKTLLAGVNREEDPDRAAVHLWNVTNGEEVRAAGLTGARAESLRFAPDGRTLVTLAGDTMTIRNWPQGERLREITLPQGEVRGFRTLGSILDISRDSELLVTMVRHVNLWRGQAIDAAGGSLDLWARKNGKHLQRLAGSDGLTERAAFTVRGELVITSDTPLWGTDHPLQFARGILHVVDAGTGRLKRMFPVPARVTALAVSPDGRTAYLGSAEGTIHACEVASGGVRYEVAGHHDRVTALAIVARGRRLVSASGDASALAWDLSIPPAIAPDRLDPAWNDLAATDASRAYQAMADLAAAPKRSIRLLAERLPTTRPEPGSDLPSPARLREIRALELLEYFGNAEARDLLATLAKGDPMALLTQDAATALRTVLGNRSADEDGVDTPDRPPFPYSRPGPSGSALRKP